MFWDFLEIEEREERFRVLEGVGVGVEVGG